MSENAGKKQGKGRGSNPNSRKNLEKGKWKPGESGNPAGMEVGTKHRSTHLKEIFEIVAEFKTLEEVAEKMPVEKAMDFALVKKALAGDIAAWREAKDSVYGKVGDTLNIGNKPGETFKTENKLVDDLLKNYGDDASTDRD
jgi:hypothetical protein